MAKKLQRAWRRNRRAERCDQLYAALVPLIWVTGSSGVGKSTACTQLESLGQVAIDADWAGYNHWVDRTGGDVVADPPYPAPVGWLDHFGWKMNRAKVETLAAEAHDRFVFLCGYVENEPEVRDLFDLVICLVIDNATLRQRLLSRTTNAFGRHPEELAAALNLNKSIRSTYRRLGATIIDAGQAPPEVAAAILAAARQLHPMLP